MDMKIIWVCAGGAIGSGLRYLVTTWSLARYGPSFPYGTVAVNLTGSLLLAFLFQFTRSSTSLSPTLQLALGTGLMGGLTTYSTFNLELIRYAEEGQARLALLYGGLTLLLALTAGFAGMALGRFVASR